MLTEVRRTFHLYVPAFRATHVIRPTNLLLSANHWSLHCRKVTKRQVPPQCSHRRRDHMS